MVSKQKLPSGCTLEGLESRSSSTLSLFEPFVHDGPVAERHGRREQRE
jgi:hypothetical protein